MERIEKDRLCPDCGGELSTGPFGQRCMRCVMSLLAEPENDGMFEATELFPELVLEEKVARGGFGTVFRAEHRQMKRPVALKFLDTALARSPEAVALFQKEMVTVGGLDHPGIVRAHDAGERDGHWYIVMEFVDGADCGALVKKHGTLPIAESCEIIRQAALALHYAHGKGLVHRDVKPGNLMIAQGTEGTKGTKGTPVLYVPSVPLVPSVKVLDFGLASLAVAPLLDNPAAVEDDSSGDRFLGTLEYVAPEQIEAPAKVDARADIYALGATLRRFLTGKPAREGASEQSLLLRMKAITSMPVGTIAELRPDLPPALVQLCDQLVALDRNQRPPSAAEVAVLLHPWCAGAELARLFTDGPLPEKPFVFPKKNRRPLWAAAAVLVAVAGVWAFPERPPVPAAPPAPPEVRSVYSPELRARLHLDGDLMPRLLSPDWEREHEYYSIHEFLNARFLPDGRIAYLSRDVDNLTISTLRLGEPLEKAVHHFSEKVGGDSMRTFVFAPDGHFAVNHIRDPKALHIRRVRPDGTLLPSLRYNYAAELPLIPYELGLQTLIKSGKEVFDGFPWGMSIVTEGQVPPNTGLRPGDVLVADEGNNHIVPNVYSTPPSLWRFRFDNDERVSLLAKGGNVPVDVTVSRHGVFMLNRTEVFADTEEDFPPNFTDRILRWEKDGFHPCTTDKPIHDPTGIAADPTSTDLYIVQGGFVPSVSRSIQRVVRLRLTAPDHYTVELLADRFGKVGKCGIAVSPDGRRIIVADYGNRCMVVLKRKQE
jgi:serine/threonine protein kinase